ncbi:EamA family transporter [Actinomadura parmotrematis]|uniref:EamA family transporter n=1 Tax=Actinomadura parmotrematis TaxID=2864039 RepID=A0ABS7G4X7_9ACTN|nr:EamA family transporter [Actinomadura parmotrematis]MBW8486683.1 EamA family transporter [Actinomadura parmotrematis]
MPRSPLTGLLGLWVSLTLGVPFLLISVAGRALPPASLTCARFALAAVTVLAVGTLRGGARATLAGAARLLRGRPLETAAVALCSAALPSLLIAAGERHVPTGLTSLLLATTPMWIAVGAIPLAPAERLGRARWACLAAAFAGTALMSAGGGGATWWALLPAAAAVSYAAGGLIVRFRLRDADATALTCAQMAVAALATAPFALPGLAGAARTPGPWAAVLALGVVCSGLGWLANTVLVQRAGAVQASLVSFAAPVVAVLLGTVVLGERLAPVQAGAAAVVVAAVAAFAAPRRAPARRKGTVILELAVLGFLADGPLHAYALRKRITRLVGHVRPVSDGALYPALERLRKQGLLSREQAAGEGGPPRRVHALTAAGHAELRRRLAEPDALDVSDRNRYFVVLAFLHLLPVADQIAVLDRRRAFLDDPGRGFFGDGDGDRPLREDELGTPFRAGLQRIARATSVAERAWLAETLAGLRAAAAGPSAG